MKKSILENHDFVLGVEEEWNLYYEVIVKFIEEVTINANTYHLFVDESTKKYFYLRPRYSGHNIAGVFVEKQVIVNLFAVDSEPYQADKKQSITHATGVLKIPNS